MPSPFPGMDPFIEMSEWTEFHVQMIVEFQRLLSPQVRPKYVARTERRVYLEHLVESQTTFQPDVQIFKSDPPRSQSMSSAGSVVVEIEPKIYAVPLPREERETYLEIRTADSNQVVTVIELLSPTNKRRGSDGFRAYYDKREELLQAGVNLVEIDLLRLGVRPITVEPLAAETDYCALVHRANRRGQAEVYEWTIRNSLPGVRVPLANGDPDVLLPLQRAFVTVYDFNAYELTLRYRDTTLPDIKPGDAEFISQRVASPT
jgi:hypothetical protein